MKALKLLLLATALLFFWAVDGYGQTEYKMKPVAIQTRWAKEVSPSNALKEYPRPQLVRSSWVNLNGLWEYAITAKDAAQPSSFTGSILVPYPIESALSGVKKVLLPEQNLWYRRSFSSSGLKSGEKMILHFGAVDYQATVFLNGKKVGEHEGGYTEFSFDVTSFLIAGSNEIVVKVYDPSGNGVGPHGKQVLNPANIYYTPSSGIWQTVWTEIVPAVSVSDLVITPDIDKSVVNVTVRSSVSGSVSLLVDGITVSGKSNTVIPVPVKNAKLWSPASPYLYDLTVKMGSDVVKSYFGMRKISVGKVAGVDRILLNNKPYYNLGTLDQGFWPDGLYTAPTDEALAFDIKAIKAMGFNTIRKHIKVEPARWYYWADKLGMLVWQDMVNPNQGLPSGSKEAFEKGSAEILSQLHNAPSIVTWVLFNEKWGQYDQERLTSWIKSVDPSRLVNGHSGEYLYVNDKLRSPSPNAYVNSDMTDVHSYPDPMMSITMAGKARVCGEFGGIGVFIPEHQWLTGSAWGYIQEKPAGLLSKYKIMNQHLKLLESDGLSGSIYTQPFDVEGEQNGLMTYDREVVKIPFASLRSIHSMLNPDMGKIPEVSAVDADLTEPGLIYSKLLDEYIKGKRGADFIRKLTMYAAQAGDKSGVAMLASEYLKGLSAPYSADDLAFVQNNTTKVSDAGFAILQAHLASLSGTEQRTLYVKLMNIIYGDVIAPFVPTPQAKPDWNAVWEKVKGYGAPGEEMFLRAKVIHTMNQQDWENFKPVAISYLEKYGANVRENEKAAIQKNIDEHE
ncbi:MAG: glycoside hydrolase family 2 [Chitinophagaceae bacterium]|nr:MAG: glycoside hydrolase family 2 [Chitinophagaceae bacterium]